MALRGRHNIRGSTAFLLAKIAMDQQGSAAEAERWLRTYLSEDPGGVLSDQALGRLLELHRSDRSETTRDLARQYLDRHPRGAYAELAASLLSQ
jgi:hypothetical protein